MPQTRGVPAGGANWTAPLEPIVIVEDDPVTLAGWMELLRDAGYEVVGAGTFEEGRDALQAHPALLIIDVRLGAFNGLQLVIRARSEYPDLPLIVVTGFADEAVQRAADMWGAIYFEKPVDPEHLLAAVARALASAPASVRRRNDAPDEGPTSRQERRRWVRPQRVRVILSTPHGDPAEKDPSFHPSLIEDGDVIIARESAAAKRQREVDTGSETPQFRLSIRGLHYMLPRLFARYDQAVLHGEALAAERSVRLFYVDTGILILLKDHRPIRTVH